MAIAPEIVNMAAEITKQCIGVSGGQYIENPEKVAAFLDVVVHKLDELRWSKSVGGAG
ncbi:MAG: hypothetical protein L0212_03660 [Acidobacteria bacterium]|nr:hypothetical protein [Acidobacteriota bacterium]